MPNEFKAKNGVIAPTLISTVTTGTAPLTVASTTKVTNLNADLLDGLDVHTSTNNEVNKIVRTDSNGYIQAGWINTISGNNGTTAIDRVYASSDGYIRYYTPTNFRTVLNVPTRTGGDASGTWGINVTGSAATLTTGRTIALTGDVTYTSGSFNGSANVTGTATLANSGVTAGTYTKLTVDAKGRVTTGASLVSADLPTYTGTITSAQITTGLGYTPLQIQAGAVTDLNTAGSGIWRVNTAITNQPTGTDYGTLVSFDNVSDTGFQIVSDYASSHLYWRSGNASVYGGTGTFGAWRKLVHDNNYTDYTVTKTGTGASGTWGINVTGNAATVTNGVYTTNDQSITGLKRFETTNNSIANAAGDLARIEARGTGGAAFIQFHRPSAYAAYFGLDSDNQWKVGGWSMGAVAYPILHSNNYNTYSLGLFGTTLSIADWNSLTAFGSRRTGPDGADANGPPINQYGNLLVFGSDNGVTQLQAGHDGRLAWRTKWNATDWTAWSVALDSNNFNSYALPLVGGTLTGNMTISAANGVTSQLRLGQTGIVNWDIRNTAATGVLHITNGSANSLSLESLGAGLIGVYVNSTGNVGIGTTTPTGKLDIAGSAGNIQFNTAGDQIAFTRNAFNYLTASGAAATLQIQASGASGVLTFATAGSERMRIASTGALGLAGANYGITGQVLTSNGSGSAPSWQSNVVNLTYVIDNGDSVINTGIKGDLVVPFACTINSWTILADVSGSIVVDIWKDTYANYPPTVADTITGSAKPTVSATNKNQSSTLTGWTTSITSSDILRFNVDSAATIKRITLVLSVTRT